MSKPIKLKDLLSEQPGQPPKPGGSKGGEEETEKKLKIDIPDTPFEPDVQQIKDQLKRILKQWEIKQYKSDEHRWKCYHRDISKLVKHLTGDKGEV